ncbi:MAG TPA: DsrE family protein [Euzebyales bacterium]|nr:DsrE family protein [Euzebyales bacterium]
MSVLMIINGAAYGSELPFNGLRLAAALVKREGVDLRVFLMGDAVVSALEGQQLPDGYYHLDRMVQSITRRGAEVGCCGTCMDARAVADEQLVKGAVRSTMEQLADWTLEADKVVTF